MVPTVVVERTAGRPRRQIELDLDRLAAGGIRSPEDLEAVAAAGCEGAIVGRALLEGRLTLSVLAGGQRP